MSIDADLLAELKARPNNNMVVFELDLKTGTTYKYSEAWAAASAGMYEGRVVQSGSIERSVSDSGFNLPDDSATVTIHDDVARTLEQVLMGSAVGSIAGTAARIKLASKTLASSKWFTLFSGVVSSFASPSPFLWTFSLKRDDKALKSLISIPAIQSYDWPNAPSDSLGISANVVYGKHSSTGTAVTGMVPTTYVDNSGFRYLISYGRISSLDAVYVDGVLEAAANYALTYVETNGRSWSLVDFTSDQGATADITVDCEGFETNGDGSSGAVIVNPATQLEHLLTNFVFGTWMTGSWLTTASYPINETYVAEVETYLSDKGIAKGSRVIPGSRKGIDVLNEWCSQFQVASFWTYAGKLAIRVDDHTTTGYVSAPHFRQEISPEPEARAVTFSSRELVDEVRTEYIYSAADGDFQKQLTVKDGSKGHNAAESISLEWRESVA